MAGDTETTSTQTEEEIGVAPSVERENSSKEKTQDGKTER